MTEKIYLSDARMQACSATVVALRHHVGDRWSVRLDRTVFHPQGGGQKADRGRIGQAHVLHVAHDGPDVDHFVDSPIGIEIGAPVQLEIDSTWRCMNAVYHSAGHLLAGIVEKLYPGARAASGHQWPGEARVEFETAMPREALDLAAINAALAEAIESAWPVRVHYDDQGIRHVQMGDMPSIPCGGTHVEMLDRLQLVSVESIKVKSGRARMSYTAVGRPQ